jgi:hypothetical protein
MTEFDTSPQDTPPATEPQDTTPPKTQVEEFSISGDNLMSRIQELLHESNIRRILVKNQEGRVLLDLPLTAGIIGGTIGISFFAPLVAIAAIGGMVARLTLVVERRI